MTNVLRSSVFRHLRRQCFLPMSERCLYWPGAFFSSGTIRNSDSSTARTVNISDRCVQKLKKLANENMLRVSVDGGGCSGFQYKFELDSTVNEEDRVFEKDGMKLVVDEVSLEYLDGATVDYHEELIRSAFRVVSNPIAEQGCSCGASFSVKL